MENCQQVIIYFIGIQIRLLVAYTLLYSIMEIQLKQKKWCWSSNLLIKLRAYETLNNLLLLQWNDETDNALPLKSIRDNCPCANCAGETDVFGNIYKGPAQIMNEKSYLVSGIQPVGYYAIRPFWKDGHSDGIFSFEYLQKLCDTFDKWWCTT